MNQLPAGTDVDQSDEDPFHAEIAKVDPDDVSRNLKGPFRGRIRNLIIGSQPYFLLDGDPEKDEAHLMPIARIVKTTAGEYFVLFRKTGSVYKMVPTGEAFVPVGGSA